MDYETKPYWKEDGTVGYVTRQLAPCREDCGGQPVSRWLGIDRPRMPKVKGAVNKSTYIVLGMLFSLI
ncbi:hypothetical protein M514_09134, partial [Trichuris suis]|uniref:Uncharacterized protein n=1 Tax=Trichuris suis TaxID=68888 RepID=A0A085LYJ5_9BILA